MKRILLAISLSLLTVSLAEAWRGRGGCCAPRCAPVCAPAPVCCEPAVPVCTKTIMVPKTIQVPQVVNVPARKIVTPQPDIIEYIPQCPIEVRIPQPPIPQPDRIEYRCVPDKVVHHKQPPCVRYECPADSDQARGCGC